MGVINILFSYFRVIGEVLFQRFIALSTQVWSTDFQTFWRMHHDLFFLFLTMKLQQN